MARRRIHPPWIPGFWPLVAFLLLLFVLIGYFYVLGRTTVFERVDDKAEAAVGTAK